MAFPATHNRSASEPINRNVPLRDTPKHLHIQSTTETSTLADIPPLTSISDEPSSGGALSEDTRYDDPKEGSGKFIPSRSEYPNRTLVICYDGTGDQFDDDVRSFFSPQTPISSPWSATELEHRTILFYAQKR